MDRKYFINEPKLKKPLLRWIPSFEIKQFEFQIIAKLSTDF